MNSRVAIGQTVYCSARRLAEAVAGPFAGSRFPFRSVAGTAAAVFAVCSLASSSACASEVVALEPDRDNTLIEREDGSRSSGAGMFLFAGMNSDSTARRALLAFDVLLPGDAVIDSVFLQIHVSRVNHESEEPLTVHRVLQSWGEGASNAGEGGGGSPSQNGDATWIHRFYPDQEWSNPGGDFVATPSAELSTTGTGFYTFSGEALAADVRSWIENPETSHGWLIRGDETEPTTARRIDSREHTDTQMRPKLIIYFTPTVRPVVESSWGRVKARF